jgi:hypothetical protein
VRWTGLDDVSCRASRRFPNAHLVTKRSAGFFLIIASIESNPRCPAEGSRFFIWKRRSPPEGSRFFIWKRRSPPEGSRFFI